MIKIIYAEKGLDGFSREQFVRRWRKHGAYAMGYDDFWNPVNRYLHNNSVMGMSGFPHSQPDYDGVGELVFTSLEDCNLSLSAPSLRDIALDADQFFSRRDLISLVCEAHQLSWERFAEIKVFTFVHCAAAISREAFFRQWNEQLETLLAEPGEFSALLRQLTSSQPLKPTPTRPVMAKSNFDAVLDMSFDTIDDARRGYNLWLSAVLASADKPLINPDSLVTIVTHSSLQYDRSHFVS